MKPERLADRSPEEQQEARTAVTGAFAAYADGRGAGYALFVERQVAGRPNAVEWPWWHRLPASELDLLLSGSGLPVPAMQFQPSLHDDGLGDDVPQTVPQAPKKTRSRNRPRADRAAKTNLVRPPGEDTTWLVWHRSVRDDSELAKGAGMAATVCAIGARCYASTGELKFSMDRMARDWDMRAEAISGHLKALERAGYLKAVGKGHRGSTVWQLTKPLPPPPTVVGRSSRDGLPF